MFRYHILPSFMQIWVTGFFFLSKVVEFTLPLTYWTMQVLLSFHQCSFLGVFLLIIHCALFVSFVDESRWGRRSANPQLPVSAPNVQHISSPGQPSLRDIRHRRKRQHTALKSQNKANHIPTHPMLAIYPLPFPWQWHSYKTKKTLFNS